MTPKSSASWARFRPAPAKCFFRVIIREDRSFKFSAFSGAAGPKQSLRAHHSSDYHGVTIDIAVGAPLARAHNKKPGLKPGFSSSSCDSVYFRSSCWPVHDPSIRRILPRSTAPLFAAAKEPSTWVLIASALAVAPSNAAQFL